MTIYRIFADGELLFDTSIDSHRLISASVSLELNKAGSLTFTMPSSHPFYEKLYKLKTIIEVFQGDFEIFRGRILNMSLSFNKNLSVTCEGELAFLNDTLQRPYDFLSGDKHTTISELFAFFIKNHNQQSTADFQFKVGNVTVTDGNDYIVKSDSTYLSTFDSINNKLIDSFGGYLVPRHESDGVYLDYLADLTDVCGQSVRFAENLLDFTREQNGEDVATAILPLGAKDEDDNYLTIAGVDDYETDDICKSGDVVYSKAAEQIYGQRITKTVTFDKVTTTAALEAKALVELGTQRASTDSIELTAADLSAIYDDMESFKLGMCVETKSEPHSLNEALLISKLSIDLLNPSKNSLSVGKTKQTFTSLSSGGIYGGATSEIREIKNITADGKTDDGSNKYSVNLTDGTKYEIICPTGATGATGATGEKGDKGDAGVGILGISYVEKDKNGGNVYSVSLSDGTAESFTAPKGDKGDKGDTGTIAYITTINVSSWADGATGTVDVDTLTAITASEFVKIAFQVEGDAYAYVCANYYIKENAFIFCFVLVIDGTRKIFTAKITTDGAVTCTLSDL